MSTLATVARLEFLRARRRRVLRVAATLVATLLAVGFTLELIRHREQHNTQAELQRRVDAEWRAQPDRHPHRASHFGTYAFRPPGALSFLDPGVESYTGGLTFLEPHQRNLPSFSAASQSSELLRFGRPSLAFVLQVVVPLLLFCTTFASVAGEREAGTWTLAIAQGVKPRALLFGKALGALATVGAWLTPLLAACTLLALVSGLMETSWDTALRYSTVLAAYALYLSSCALLGVWLSSLHRLPQAALLSAMAVWFAFWVVLPQLTTAMAANVIVSPSRAELQSRIARAIRKHGDSHDPDNPHFEDLKAKTLRQYQVSRVEDLPINYGGVVMTEGEKISSHEFTAFHESLTRSYTRQDELALGFGLYSPRLAMRALSMALAGTDTHHVARFDADVEDHRYHFVQQLNQLHTENIRWENDRAQRVERAEWGRFRGFEFQRPKVGWALSQVVGPALALPVWTALIAAALYASARRRSLQS